MGSEAIYFWAKYTRLLEPGAYLNLKSGLISLGGFTHWGFYTPGAPKKGVQLKNRNSFYRLFLKCTILGYPRDNTPALVTIHTE